jgi:hypothetical protein
MSPAKASEVVKLNLRLPKNLHRRLTRDAKQNNVSLNTEIINQLEGFKPAQVEMLTEMLRVAVDKATRDVIAAQKTPEGRAADLSDAEFEKRIARPLFEKRIQDSNEDENP